VLSRLTRQEQKILLLLILVITVGMGIHYVRSRSGRHGVWVEPSPSGSEEVGKAMAAAGTANQAEHGRPAIPPSIARRSDVNGRLDLNRATLEQLDELPGIGAKKAQLIIDYREANNGFRAVEELLNVSGIGEKTYSDLQQYVCVGESEEGQPSANFPRLPSPFAPAVPTGTAGPGEQKEPQAVLAPDAPVTRININTATSEELKSLDGIGDVLAGRIMQYRQEQGPFRSPQDIMKVNGIGKVRYEANKHRIVVK
jgi:competence protein ComEA